MPDPNLTSSLPPSPDPDEEVARFKTCLAVAREGLRRSPPGTDVRGCLIYIVNELTELSEWFERSRRG